MRFRIMAQNLMLMRAFPRCSVRLQLKGLLFPSVHQLVHYTLLSFARVSSGLINSSKPNLTLGTTAFHAACSNFNEAV